MGHTGATMGDEQCRHCRTRKRTRPRGLCWGCSGDPNVRALYPSTSKYARRGVLTTAGVLPEPTAALPGTPEKLAVLAARAANKELLWHPRDNRGG